MRLRHMHAHKRAERHAERQSDRPDKGEVSDRSGGTPNIVGPSLIKAWPTTQQWELVLPRLGLA